MTNIDRHLQARGLPPLGHILGLLLADVSTARKAANLLDHATHRRLLSDAGCSVREATGGALDVTTAAGHAGKFASYVAPSTARRITIQVGRRVASLEVAPGEVAVVLSWIPALVAALASGKSAPAVPVPVSATSGPSNRIVSAAAAALSKPVPAACATARALALRNEGLSYGQIARQLQAEGYVPPVVGGWNPNRVRALLVAAGLPTVRQLA